MEPVNTAAVVLVPVLIVALVAMSIRIVQPGERLVVFRLGKTSAVLIRGYAGRQARYLVFIIPVVDRVVRVRGDLVVGWDALRDSLPEGWVIGRPEERTTRVAWLVRAHGPDGDGVEGAGSNQREALDDLAYKLAERAAIVP
jgi:hypothetical protein